LAVSMIVHGAGEWFAHRCRPRRRCASFFSSDPGFRSQSAFRRIYCRWPQRRSSRNKLKPPRRLRTIAESPLQIASCRNARSCCSEPRKEGLNFCRLNFFDVPRDRTSAGRPLDVALQMSIELAIRSSASRAISDLVDVQKSWRSHGRRLARPAGRLAQRGATIGFICA